MKKLFYFPYLKPLQRTAENVEVVPQIHV